MGNESKTRANGAQPPRGPFKQHYGFTERQFDFTSLPDYDTNFLLPEHLEAFIQALIAPDPLHSPDETRSPRDAHSPSLDYTQRESTLFDHDDPRLVAAEAAGAGSGGGVAPSFGPADDDLRSASASAGAGGRSQRESMFITAKNDWAPIHEKVQRSTKRARKKRKSLRPGRRTTDETREGYLYGLLKWPFLLTVAGWLLGLSGMYLLVRAYIAIYESFVTLRGRRVHLRNQMRRATRYRDWVAAARELDQFLGNTAWKAENDYAYYDAKTVRRVYEQVRRCRAAAEAVEMEVRGGKSLDEAGDGAASKAAEDLRALVEACVKNNFVGIENPRLYSQTYFGTKNLVQNYVEEVEKSLKFLSTTQQFDLSEKRSLFKILNSNYGRTALCLSGGAGFAYYHFGVLRALLEENLLPEVITGTSGGGLVAALACTRTNEELKDLLVPALAGRITACREPISVWFRRWWKTGARFDSIDWAKQCSWWTHGSMTFREAYERTGRILNISCVPADPHTPTILCNYLTSPDCVIWSAVIASAAVPGILNPVVLMMKTRAGNLVPYSFGHKWKDGSLRTDIPIKALNLQFNVNFTIVSQVNPHVNLFFFSSRGTVGSPVEHRRGRGWRGGYLGSAVEQYIKLDLTKWLRVLKQLELLPRALGQDWSQLWLQQFGGTITLWPRTQASDFLHILSDPDPPRLARMLHEGRQSIFPKLRFVSNRLRIERLVEQGRLDSRPTLRRGSIETIISEDDLRSLLRRTTGGAGGIGGGSTTVTEDESSGAEEDEEEVMLSIEPNERENGTQNSTDDQDFFVVPGEPGIKEE